jgi:ADP-ribose pyrophosphatase YjhB (NUDIX family)
MKYCCQCATELSNAVPPGDTHERLQCPECGYVVYENPKILVACFATWEDKVVWMKRATHPQKGFWSIPTGFMETGETPEQAAARELWEETGARIDPQNLELFLVGSLPFISEVYLAYRGPLDSTALIKGEESLEVSLFSNEEAPWNETAYPQVTESIQQFYTDHQRSNYGVYRASFFDGQHVLNSIPSP